MTDAHIADRVAEAIQDAVKRRTRQRDTIRTQYRRIQAALALCDASDGTLDADAVRNALGYEKETSA